MVSWTGLTTLVAMAGWLWSATAVAFTCDASVNRATVAQGGEIILTVAASGDVGWSPTFGLPEIPGVRIYAGGTNQSMSMVNGRTETSVARTYYLKVEAAEDFSIGPITITAEKQQCETKPISIRVTAADPNQNIPPDQSGNRTPPVAPGRAPAGQTVTAGQRGDEVFITLEADRQEAWVGQQVVLTFRYWRRVQPWNNPSYTPPRTEGFWREDLGAERNVREVLHGRAYNVTEIRYALFPTRAGELEIGPAELSFPAGVFDRFFQTRRTQQGPNVLRTDPVTIRVKELPQPRPANFSGIVATRVKLVSQVDRDTVPRGEAVGLKVRLDADAFLKGFGGLKVPTPAASRLHDAGESFATNVEEDRLKGRISIEKVIVPQREGVLEVPPVELVWFDTGAEKYRTASTASWPIAVTPSDRPRASTDESGFLRSEIARLGDDLAFIHQVPGKLAFGTGPGIGGGLWWTLFLMPVALLVLFKVWLQKILIQRRNPAERRRRLALAAALQHLAAGQSEAHVLVARAVCGFVADREGRPVAGIGPQEVRAHCAAAGKAEIGEKLAEALAACDALRYGHADQQGGGLSPAQTGQLLRELAAAEATGPGPRAGVLPLLVAASLLVAAGTGVCGSSPVAAAEKPGKDPVQLMAEGNQAYTAGELAAARDLYLAARRSGVNDAALHFNLGNAHARLGQLGEAVASYLRAQRLDPRDADIRANLAWVRGHLKDLELADDSLPLFIAQIAGLVAAFTLGQWGWFLVAIVWVLAMLVGWAWYRELVSAGLRRALLGVAGLALVVALITAGRWYVEEYRETAVVVDASIAVRSGPAENFATLFEVHDGLTLQVVGYRDDWVRVGLGGSWQGWLPAASIVPVRLPEPDAQGR